MHAEEKLHNKCKHYKNGAQSVTAVANEAGGKDLEQVHIRIGVEIFAVWDENDCESYEHLSLDEKIGHMSPAE